MSNYMNSCKENQTTSVFNALLNTPEYNSGGIWPWARNRLTINLATWHQRYVQRRSLNQLSQHLLNDINITREQAIDEANKPFWTA